MIQNIGHCKYKEDYIAVTEIAVLKNKQMKMTGCKCTPSFLTADGYADRTRVLTACAIPLPPFK